MDSTTNRKDKGCKVMGDYLKQHIEYQKERREVYENELEEYEKKVNARKEKLRDINHIIKVLEMSY